MIVIENCNSLSDLRQKLIDGEEVRTRQEPYKVSEYDKDHIWYKGNQYISLRRFLEVKAEAEKEPCEDAISREDAFMCLTGEIKDTDTVETVIARFVRRIKKLSSVTSQPKTGHWIYKIYGGFHEQGDWYCSHCDYQFNYGNGHAKHCPECGYEMSEAPTEEVIRDKDYDWIIKR